MSSDKHKKQLDNDNEEGKENDNKSTTSQHIKEFADIITKTSIARLSLDGQLRQARISLERYIDEEEQILTDKEMIIPKFALSKAKGIVFLSIIKCGFVFAGCIGTGCVIVKNKNNLWSGPSSIACAGLSIGLLAGASKIDYIMILPNRMAVKSFMSSGQLRIGTNSNVSLGLIGRNANANIGAGNRGGISIVYSYSHSKGLYGGISLNGKILTVRNECNKEFYGENVNNEAILCGDIVIPINKKSNEYDQIIYILQSYCHSPDDDIKDDDSQYKIKNDNIKSGIVTKKKKKHVNKHHDNKMQVCTCKLCQMPSLKLRDKNNNKIDNNGLNKHQHRYLHNKTLLDATNPFKNNTSHKSNHIKSPKKQNKASKKQYIVNRKRSDIKKNKYISKSSKLNIMKKQSATKITSHKLLEPTPSPPPLNATATAPIPSPPPPSPPPIDKTYRYNNDKLHIVGTDVTVNLNDPWKDNKKNKIKSTYKKTSINYDPYALNVRPWDKLIEINYSKKINNNNDNIKNVINNVKKTVKQQSFCIDIDEQDNIKDKKDINDAKKQDNNDLQTVKKHDMVKSTTYHQQYSPNANKNVSNGSSKHYSDVDVTKYSLDNYDNDGYRLKTFSLLFQIHDINYQTEIKIAGKLLSKQYVVNWPRKRDCKAVIIVTSKVFSSYYTSCKDDDDDNEYELRLIIYDQRDDDLIVYNIDISFRNIAQIVSAINGAFIISPSKPWIILESIFKSYNKKMYESMIDISDKWFQTNILAYGDIIRVNFGSLCQYGLYVGDNEIVCFRRRFPNNGSSVFRKLRLFLTVFNGNATKKIRIKYMTLEEFIIDSSRIEVIYYPIPCISNLYLVKKALCATENNVNNCICEISMKIKDKITITPKEMIEESVLSVIDNITATVNNITEAVSPLS